MSFRLFRGCGRRLSCSEALSPLDRGLIETAFGAPTVTSCRKSLTRSLPQP